MGKFKLQSVDTSIFESALNNNLLLRCETGDYNKDFYCIAKTSDGDYILEERKNASSVEKMSSFATCVRWRIVGNELPKAFIPREDGEFWFIHLMQDASVMKATFRWDNKYYHSLAKAGLAFKTEEDAKDALIFFQNNIEG